MTKLKPAQILLRVNQILKTARPLIDGLEETDGKAILKGVYRALFPNTEAAKPITGEAGDMQTRILKAIKEGLDGADAQMVRAAMDWQEDHAGREYLRELVVNITPYTIADKSLPAIVRDAGDDVIAQIEGALAERAGASSG